MIDPNLTRTGGNASRKEMGKIGKLAAAAAMLVPLGGCVELTAPERPIEINLNINIRQEVVVRLQEDARELIQRNPGVF